MATMTQPSPPTWSTYTRFLRRHLGALVVLAVVGLLVGLVMARAKPATYTATTDVVVNPVPSYVAVQPRTRPPMVTIDSDAQLVVGSQVIARVASRLGESQASVKGGLSVTAVPLSQVLHVTFTGRSRADAVRGSTVAAQAFLDVRRRVLVALRAGQIARIGPPLRVVEGRLLAEQRANPVVPLDDPALQQYVTLTDRAEALARARTSSAEIIRRAQPPRGTDSVDTEVYLTSGAMLGILLASALGAVSNSAGPASGEVRRRGKARALATNGRSERLDLPGAVGALEKGGTE
jgi:polysaccharide biosynthesis transport protein